jgi:hypothetical protein
LLSHVTLFRFLTLDLTHPQTKNATSIGGNDDWLRKAYFLVSRTRMRD